MLTVKHRAGVLEDIVSAESVTYVRKTDENPAHLKAFGVPCEGRLTDTTFTSGEIYVMNSNGKTVANYHLAEMA